MIQNSSLRIPATSSTEPKSMKNIPLKDGVNFLIVHSMPYSGDLVKSSLKDSIAPRLKNIIPSDKSCTVLLSIPCIGENKEYRNINKETINNMAFQSFSIFISFRYLNKLSIVKSLFYYFVFVVISIIANWDLAMYNKGKNL